MKIQIVFLAFVVCSAFGQEPRVFTTEDFDLLGQVKSCLVITDYGKEAFEFDRKGLLTKVTTIYSDTDYDISYYKYSRGLLKEKRLENYREDSLDRQTSLAHVYSIDTLLNKVVKESVYSYQREFLDQFQYKYDTTGNLIAVIRTTNEGIDDTQITYDTLRGEITKTINVNGITEHSLRTAEKEVKGQLLRVELEKKYLKGEPYKATESFKDTLGRTLREINFDYDEEKSGFAKSGEVSYIYEEQGFLKTKIQKTNNSEKKQEYIYQFDGHEPSNWIKMIITPDNQYTTRRITYYKDDPPETDGEG
ncbi:hypothetical protein [Muriicola soli]|uniref:YD repeat-containing protein n=1 Tax=Muriicola soli TaxID=2507538 RepID=A0A411E9L1_9FLAO|nr:hypothetical protein [Muriicola soli]QBA64328.1 hypothetical protein EQY75_07160 [Muriicola soli]